MRTSLFSLVLFLAACATPTHPDQQPAVVSDSSGVVTGAAVPTLFGVRWRLVELQGEAITSAPDGPQAHLTFHAADSTVSGSGGCNSLFGPFQLHGPTGLRFGNLMSTQMACADMGVEDQLHAALPTVDGYTLRGDTLLLMSGEKVVGKWGRGE